MNVPGVNRLSWAAALALATYAAKISCVRQRVYKDPAWGWTWDSASTEVRAGE